MQNSCLNITLHVRKRQMEGSGPFVCFSLTTNPQKHTEESDVIAQEMSAYQVS